MTVETWWQFEGEWELTAGIAMIAYNMTDGKVAGNVSSRTYKVLRQTVAWQSNHLIVRGERKSPLTGHG